MIELSSTNPRCEYLSKAEREALQKIEQGQEGDGVREFLLASFARVRGLVFSSLEKVELDDLFEILDDASPNWNPVAGSIFWRGEELTAWAEAFLNWEQHGLHSDFGVGLGELAWFINHSYPLYAPVLDSDFP